MTQAKWDGRNYPIVRNDSKYFPTQVTSTDRPTHYHIAIAPHNLVDSKDFILIINIETRSPFMLHKVLIY